MSTPSDGFGVDFQRFIASNPAFVGGLARARRFFF